MSIKAKKGEPDQAPQTSSEPEENLSAIADDPTFSALEFDREHGDEVGAANTQAEPE